MSQQSLLREKTLQKLRRERKYSKANLIDTIKGMNENQLEKIHKILNAKIENAEDDGQNEVNTGSIIGETEADELNDKVEELQDALAQDQGMQDDTLSRVSSKSYQSLRSKVGMSPLSQAGSSLTRLSQLQSLRQELEQEKNARLTLERELEELKKISSEINNHLSNARAGSRDRGLGAWQQPPAGVPNRY